MFGADLSPQNHINQAIREKSAHPIMQFNLLGQFGIVDFGLHQHYTTKARDEGQKKRNYAEILQIGLSKTTTLLKVDNTQF